MSRIVFFLYYLCLLQSCSVSRYQTNNVYCPELNCINLVDRDGLTEMIRTPERLKQYEAIDYLKPQPYQKIMRVFSRDPQGNISAIITTYHPNGYPKQYLEVINNQAHGFYKEWHPNGALKVEGKTIGGSADISTSAEKTWIFDGLTRAWDENGTLIAEIDYSKGELDGLSTYYHSTGAIWKTIPYEKSLVNGFLCIYLENGDLLQKTEFKAGVKTGQSFRYWQDGSIAAREDYVRGRLWQAEYFNPKGEQISTIEKGSGYRAAFGKDCLNELQEYKNGVLEGEVLMFSPNGQIARVYHMKNELKHGEEMIFYPHKELEQESFPKMSITWYQGKIQGLVKTWYDNGVMESQRSYSENEKNGFSTAWYRDGNLMLIEEYDQGKLVKGDYYRKKERQPVSHVIEGKGVVTMFDAEGNFLKKVNYHHGKPES